MNISRRVATVSGFPVQYNKAIVGKNAFAHESGIHQDGMLKNAETFEIMRPTDVGLTETSLVMGKHSGRAALRSKLKDLGFELSDNQLQDVFVRLGSMGLKQGMKVRYQLGTHDGGQPLPCKCQAGLRLRYQPT